jgi:catechol 2,3-dioxygenase-like lactoylglutathione lyase family enzyme
MANEKVVPVFPTASLKATLEFYTMLGFTVLYEQHAPYVYGSVSLENIQIDFFGNKALVVNQETGHICLVVLTNIDQLHAAFSSQIKTAFGKQLRSGIPRMSSLNDVRSADRRFNLIDPSGNRLTFIQVGKKTPKTTKGGTPLARAIKGAKLDAFSRDAPDIAARYFDHALEQAASESVVIQFQAFVLRADIAAALDDTATLEKYVKAAKNLVLKEHEKLEVQEELGRLAELEEILVSNL